MIFLCLYSILIISSDVFFVREGIGSRAGVGAHPALGTFVTISFNSNVTVFGDTEKGSRKTFAAATDVFYHLRKSVVIDFQFHIFKDHGTAFSDTDGDGETRRSGGKFHIAQVKDSLEIIAFDEGVHRDIDFAG